MIDQHRIILVQSCTFCSLKRTLLFFFAAVTVSKDPKPEVPASPKKEVVVKPSVVKPSPAPSSTSTFTAVTSTGEAASISDLREKQAARRKKAMLFLKAKTEAVSLELEQFRTNC